MEFHFYTMDFFFLSREVSYIHSERLITIIYFMLCSYFQNNECKNLEIREGRQEQWNSTSTPWIFFISFTRSFLYTFRKIPYIYLFHAVFVFPEQWMQKISKFEGKTRGMESHFYNMVFFSLSRELSYFFCTISHFFCKSENIQAYTLMFTWMVITCGVFGLLCSFLLQSLCFHRTKCLGGLSSVVGMFSTFCAAQKVDFYTYLTTPLIFTLFFPVFC